MALINFDELIQKLTVLEYSGHYMAAPCAGSTRHGMERYKYNADGETAATLLEKLEPKISELDEILSMVGDDYSIRETKTLIQQAIDLLKNAQ